MGGSERHPSRLLLLRFGYVVCCFILIICLNKKSMARFTFRFRKSTGRILSQKNKATKNASAIFHALTESVNRSNLSRNQVHH